MSSFEKQDDFDILESISSAEGRWRCSGLMALFKVLDQKIPGVFHFVFHIVIESYCQFHFSANPTSDTILYFLFDITRQGVVKPPEFSFI